MALPFSRKYKEFKAKAVAEFYLHINDLLEDDCVQQLDGYIQHYCFSRLKHSMDVAYCSFFIAKALGWDARSTARGGLLHDLFLYDWRDESYEGKNHAMNHPKIALENAQRITTLNRVEKDIILKHMWLVTITPPKYKEGFVVTFVDKYCATREFFLGIFSGKPTAAKLPVAQALAVQELAADALPVQAPSA